MTRFLGITFLLTLAASPSARSGTSQSAPTQKPVPAAPSAEAKPAAAATPTPVAHALDQADLEAFFDGIVPLQLERSDIAGASVLVMRDGKDLLKKGYGFSDLAKKQPVDPDTTMFRLASISKLFTWISVMQLAEQGKLNIDDDVNKYLDFQIAPAFGKPITLRNLMTHTGGFEEEIRDVLLTDPRKSTTLREYLIENQPRRIFPPGEIPAYSNYGVGLAGYIVQRISGEPFEQYVSEHIFQPLGMKHSSFRQPMTSDLAPFVSDGYKKDTEKPAIGFEIFNPAPAGGVSSTAADMGRFAQALLSGGELDGQRILEPQTLQEMWTRQFAASPALPAMCMGFYQEWYDGLHFIGHEGDLIAFHSLFFLEPNEKLVIFVSYNSAGSAGKTRQELLRSFADRYFPYKPSQEFQTAPLEQLRAIDGTYEVTRRTESNRMKIEQLLEQSDAKVDKDGVLKLELAKNFRGHVIQWKLAGKDLWRETDGQQQLFAIRDSAGKIVRLAISFPGVQVERVPWCENASLIVSILDGCLFILLTVVAASLVRLGRRLFFSKRASFKPQPGTLRLTAGARLSAFTWLFLALGTAILMYHLENQTLPPSHSVDRYFVLMNWVTALAIFFSIFAVLSSVRIWRRAELRFISKLKFSLVAFACLFLTWFSIHWHIIGPAHRF